MDYKGTLPLEIKRLILRRLTVADADDMFHNWASQEAVARYMSWPVCRTVEEAKERLEAWQARYDDPKECYWGIVLKLFKFPGGGIEPGESHLQTLIRETREETGLNIIPESVREFGMVCERRRGLYEDEIFNQQSYYYAADVNNATSPQALDAYEAEKGFELVWTDIETAYRANIKLGKHEDTTFILRETYMLKLLLDMGY